MEFSHIIRSKHIGKYLYMAVHVSGLPGPGRLVCLERQAKHATAPWLTLMVQCRRCSELESLEEWGEAGGVIPTAGRNSSGAHFAWCRLLARILHHRRGCLHSPEPAALRACLRSVPILSRDYHTWFCFLYYGINNWSRILALVACDPQAKSNRRIASRIQKGTTDEWHDAGNSWRRATPAPILNLLTEYAESKDEQVSLPDKSCPCACLSVVPPCISQCQI